jgi:PKD repeat protein
MWRRLSVGIVIGGIALAGVVVATAAQAATAVIAADTFSRTIANGWGNADTGGAWTTSGASGVFTVTGSAGAITVGAGAGPTAFLSSVSSTDTDLSVSIATDKPATGSGLYVSVVGRRVTNQGDYRVKMRVQSTGSVSLVLERVSAAGTETALGADTPVPGMVYAVGDQVRVRLQVTGTSPTALRAKAWKTSDPEPASFLVTATDATAGLQVAGALGVTPYLSGGATNAPITTLVDDLDAQPTDIPPLGAFTSSVNGLSASFDGTSSTDPDGTITDYSWDFGDSSTGNGATTTHAYAAGGTYTVTLTVTDNGDASTSVAHQVTVGTAVTGTISPNAIVWDTTNGDILVSRIIHVGTTDALVIGGNFSSVHTRAGATVAATNLAVVDATTGNVLYAGTGINSYVRSAVGAANGVLYVGGDFSTFAGQPRGRVAGLTISTWTLTSFNPGLTGQTYTLEAGPTLLYVGGTFSIVHVYRLSDGGQSFQINADCGIRALLLSPDGSALYVGGFQNTTNGFAQHALVKVNSLTGAVDTGFVISLQKNSGGCGGAGVTGYDGEDTISLAWDPLRNRLLVGNGGHGANTFYSVNPTTGAKDYEVFSFGDNQAVAALGPTYLLGFHGLAPSHRFVSQNLATTGAVQAWDPKLDGQQGNADGGNNGVQSMVVDPTLGRIYLAGAFLTQNGVSRQSLAVFTFG